MTIQNGIGVTGHNDLERPVEGSPGMGLLDRPKANPLAAQVTTVTFAGAIADGVYALPFTGPDGSVVTLTATRAAGTPATFALLAIAAADNTDADDDWANVATAEAVGDTVVLTFLHAANPYAAGTAVVPGGTMVPANDVNAGGVAVPVGRFLIAVANAVDPEIPAAGLPLPGSAAADIIGFNVRDGSVENSGSIDTTLVESTPAGQMMSAGYWGTAYAVNRGTAASVAGGVVHVVVNPAGGQEPGQCRSDSDGGNTVAMSVNRLMWRDAVTPGARGQLRMKDM